MMKISLIVNKENDRAANTAVRAAEILRSLGAEVLTCRDFPIDGTTAAGTAEEIIRSCDTVVTVGGDGTIIHNAKYAALYNKPLLGVNVGRIGFVANIEPDEIDELGRLVTSDYRIQRRMLLEVDVRKGGCDRSFTAVNEVDIHRDSLSNLVDISIGLDGEKIISCRADGMLFSTPTGSTAYSFSAGGPVIQPDTRCILLTPVCPHALSSRQVVFGDSSVLSARVDLAPGQKCYLTVDGQDHIPVSSDDTITVRRSPLELQLIILKEKNFYTLLNEKLKEI